MDSDLQTHCWAMFAAAELGRGMNVERAAEAADKAVKLLAARRRAWAAEAESARIEARA